ncbi:FolC bifunctional protein [Biscogniauxia mediterranea]|nr:FolC bifunctional protein [Biscogniauxia mediterranea]
MAPRTYASALEHLSLLQSNHAITSLFAPSPPSPSAKPPTKEELNARAIPEMREWLARGGVSPADLARLRCVHVAGTKGKGSVCAYLTAILTQPGAAAAGAGRVGTYTSPHLLSVRERIQLDGRPVGEDLFARYFFETWDAFTAAAVRDSITTTTNSKVLSDSDDADNLAGPATKPFYFRFLTIMALRVFLGEGVRSAVVECGIGGEYDSTNVLPAGAVTAAVVSQLGIDHVGMLGASLPEIAWHKAGVCRPGRRCFTRRLLDGDGEQTMRVLRRRAAEKRAELVELDDRAVEAWGGVPRRGTLEGAFQKYNQALAAVAAQEHLRVLRQEEEGDGEEERGKGEEGEADRAGSLDSLPSFVLEGLARARLRGRCEVVRDGAVTWFVDGAHTGESLAEAGAWFAGQAQGARRVVLVFNQQERDAAALLRRLHESVGVSFGAAVFTRNDARARGPGEPPRDLAVQRACADAMAGLAPAAATTEVRVAESVPEAVARVREMAARQPGAEVGVLATGSLHLVGALLRTLEGGGGLSR